VGCGQPSSQESMVEAARAEALALVSADPDLKNHPLLSEMLCHRHQEIHFE